jgi:eukaryotic translation initiation factor 2C
VDAPELKSCAFVFFCKTDTANAITIRDRVLNVWSTAGMNIQCRDAPVLLCNPQIPGNVRGGLMAAFKEATELFKWRCQMIICIVDGSKPLYEQIKRICLCEAGLMSQCMVFKNVIKGNPQYLSNVAMKVKI